MKHNITQADLHRLIAQIAKIASSPGYPCQDQAIWLETLPIDSIHQPSESDWFTLAQQIVANAELAWDRRAKAEAERFHRQLLHEARLWGYR